MNPISYTPVPLDRLPLGTTAVGSSLDAEGRNLRHMEDLGFIPGACIRALHRAPAGDPTAYTVMGAVIALRRKDASRILCRPVSQSESAYKAQQGSSSGILSKSGPFCAAPEGSVHP